MMSHIAVPSGNDETSLSKINKITVIGKGSSIAADIFLRDGVVIYGIVVGNIESSGIAVVADGAMVAGYVIGDKVVIAGEVNGDVVGRNEVVLLATAHVHGNIRFGDIRIHSDAKIDGRLFNLKLESKAVDIRKS
jgi:cytoskeletal protein CcmA (bactofilin family)